MKTQRKWRAVFMALVTPGLGQIFNGEFLKGSCLAIFFALIPFLIAWLSVMLPSGFLVVGAGAAVTVGIAVYLWGVVDAYRIGTRPLEPDFPAPFQRGVFYLAFVLVVVTLMSAVQNYIKRDIVEAYKIVSTSMSPKVLNGDYVLVDKTAYEHEPMARGDIIIHVYPDDRSKDFIREIVALPGDTVEGYSKPVPHGTVLVQGSKANSKVLDSESYGPVDMRDIVGKVRQVYFSKDAKGIRWKRIGILIGG